MWVLSLSLPIPHGMHLVVPTHPCFLWVVCHSSMTYPPKELEQEPRIGFSFSPPPDHTLLPLTHDLTTSCIGWVQAGDVWALCVFHFHVYPKSAYCSRVRRGLETCLHILSPILGFLWCEPFSGFSFFKAYSFWGWAFSWPWAFPSSSHSLVIFCSLYVSCRIALPFLPWCYLTQACWASLSLLFILPSMTQYSHLSFFGCIGHPWPIYFPWALLTIFLTLHSYELLLSIGLPKNYHQHLAPWTYEAFLRVHMWIKDFPTLSIFASYFPSRAFFEQWTLVYTYIFLFLPWTVLSLWIS